MKTKEQFLSWFDLPLKYPSKLYLRIPQEDFYHYLEYYIDQLSEIETKRIIQHVANEIFLDDWENGLFEFAFQIYTIFKNQFKKTMKKNNWKDSENVIYEIFYLT
jgi:hypothetical protein